MIYFKYHATFFLCDEKVKHFMTTGKMKGKSSREKQREKMLDGLTKWLNVG